jgi:2,4-dichlorophenol 6-monooxygenase
MPTVRRPALLPPLDPEQWPAEVPVLIVGGGPAGLSAAVLLAQRGIEVLLVERRGFVSHYPRAHLLNVRTMEVFDEMGVADDVYALAPRDDRWRKVVWYTSVAGPTPLYGIKLGEVPAWGGGPDAVRYAEASPRRFSNLPQIRLDRLLWQHADAVAPGRVRGGQELTGLVQHDGGGVTATVTDRATGSVREVHARYLVAADGGRVSAGLLGTELEGPRAIRDVVSHYVSTDLQGWSEPDALLAHFIEPSGHGRTVGALQALGPWRYGRESPEWVVALTPRAGTPDDGHEAEDVDEETLLARARAMLGLPADHPITLHASSSWQYEGVVARRFRVGSAFLVGDAAHRHPPTGGLGLNCAVQDVHNLAWKLAAVLSGQAGDALLDSYERERRPIAAYYTAHALENAGRHAPIGTALGLAPGQSEDEGWAEIAVFCSDTPEGEQRRKEVAAAVAENANDYSQLNVEAGYAYEAGALVPDGTAPPLGHESPIVYQPTTRPGHHLPHVWVHPDGAADPVSTLDLVVPGRLTLLVGPAGAPAWERAALAAADVSAFPVSVVVVPDGAWAAVREVDGTGAVLVRPDRKVAWRAATAPTDPAAARPGPRPARHRRENERWTTMSEPVPDPGPLERLRRLDSCAVSDALDTLGLPGATTGLGPLWAVPGPVAGRVRTVLAGPAEPGRPAQHIAAAAIEAAGPGDVLVIANAGRVDVSSWGGILTLAAGRRGIGGVVIDGACRAIAESEEQAFPVFGRAVVPVSARGRIVQLAMEEPVEVAGTAVHPGDLVLADRNGVVFVPAAELERVLSLAERIVARESAMAEAVRSGHPVTEVMHDNRFPTVEEATP